MNDWLDAPVPGYRQRITEEWWCPRCKCAYCVVLRFDNEAGGYDPITACPYCNWQGVPFSDHEVIEED